MRVLTSIFLMLAIFILISCEKDTDNTLTTDEDIIQAIQNATDKQDINRVDLPSITTSILDEEYSESYVEQIQLAPALGYLIKVRRGEGARIGERSSLYFDLEGRALSREREETEEGGRDLRECFRMVFPITYIMPDETPITADTRATLGVAVRTWYAANSEIEERPSLQYPVALIFINGTTRTINSDAELRTAYATCEDHFANEEDDRTYDCSEEEQNIGDVCRDMTGAAGTLNADCECILFDCQDLMANIGDACRNGTATPGTVNANCECE